MALKPLSPTETERLVVERCGSRTLLLEVTQAVVRRSEGNPLFAEELLSMFLEQGTASAGLAAVDRAIAGGRQAQIPDIIAHITASRLDRLGDTVRRLLCIAATIGTRFPLDLLAAVAGLPDSVVQATLGMGSEEIVQTTRGDGTEYTFKHALVHEAVAASLLASRRREFHSRVAAELERRFSDRLQAHAEELAHHFVSAGNAERAVHYLVMSGDKCFAIYALDDADRFFEAALNLLSGHHREFAPPGLAKIVVRRMRVLEFNCAFGGIIEMAERHLPAIEARSNSVELCLILGIYAHALLHGHDYARAEQVARRGLELSELLGALLPAANAKLVQMKVLSARDDGQCFSEMARLGREIVEMATRTHDSYLACAARFQLARHYLQDGELTLARDAALDLAAQGRRYDDTRAESFAQWLLGWIHVQAREFDTAMRHAELSLATAVTEADRKVGLALKATVLALTGEPTEALRILFPIRAEVVARQDMNLVAALDQAIGVALIKAGRIRDGIRWIECAMARWDRDGNTAMVFHGHLLLGEAYACLASMKARGSKSLARAPVRARDLLYLALVTLTAKRRAERSLRAAAGNSRWKSETSVARIRIQIGLGLVAGCRGDGEAAREALAGAAVAASAAGYAGLEREAASALTFIPRRTRRGRFVAA